MKNDNSTQPLKEKEIRFATAIFNGSTYYDAYIDIYPERKETWEYNALTKEASDYAKKAGVKKHLKYLKEELQKETVLTFYDKLELLDSIIQDPNIRPQDRIKALAEHNKMLGDVATLKIEQSGKLELEHSVNPDVLDAFKKHLKK